jgi:hypothetical protein
MVEIGHGGIAEIATSNRTGPRTESCYTKFVGRLGRPRRIGYPAAVGAHLMTVLSTSGVVEKVGQTIVLCGLLGWAFGPRNFMKNSGKPGGFPDVRGGFSTLSYLAGIAMAENHSVVKRGLG